MWYLYPKYETGRKVLPRVRFSLMLMPPYDDIRAYLSNWPENRCPSDLFKNVLLKSRLGWIMGSIHRKLPWPAPWPHGSGLQSPRGLEMGKHSVFQSLTCTNPKGFSSVSDLMQIFETWADCICWSLCREKTNVIMLKQILVELCKSFERKWSETCRTHQTVRSSLHSDNCKRRFHEIWNKPFQILDSRLA